MQRKIIFTLNSGVLLLLTCAGCKSKEIPPPAEFINVPVYVAARTISADDQAKIRSAPVLRAYAVGRYVDPNRRSVMHEQHTVYREEQAPRWNLIPQPDADPVLMAQRNRRERYADALKLRWQRMICGKPVKWSAKFWKVRIPGSGRQKS